MARSIAIAGKGGTGKTTLSAFLVRFLIENGKTPVLAIDADPNSNLNQLLGVPATRSIGAIREDILKKIDEMPAGVPKETFLEYQIQETLIESKSFDLLIMGRPEGPGCYCYVNSILRKYIDRLADSYSYIVMDNEAGMEHLSRRTTLGVDLLAIVSDATLRGIETAARLRDLAFDLELDIKKTNLIVNRAREEKLPQELEQMVKEKNLELAGVVVNDLVVEEYDMKRRSVFDLPHNTKALLQAKKIFNKIVP